MTAAEKKAAIDIVPMHLARMVYLVNVKADELVKEKAVKDKHVTFHVGGKDFIDFVENFRKQERVRIPKLDKEKLGVTNASEIFAAFEKNLAKWEKLAKETGMKNDMNAMAAAYKREIYDKLDLSKL
jgi:hypothetical protein